jgi:hypothetical protein
MEPRPGDSLRSDVLRPLRVRPGELERNISYLYCKFVFERTKKKQIATITVPLMELFVLKW